MNFKLLSALILPLLSLTGLVALTPASQAQNRQFYCGIYGGHPATLVRQPRGPVPLIVYVNDGFTSAGWSPERRCHHISEKFQRFNDNGQLRYLKVGKINNANVICATRSNASNCISETVLLTVPKDMNPHQALYQLVNTRNNAFARPLRIDGSLGESQNIEVTVGNDGFGFVDVNEWIGDTQVNW